MEWGKETTPKQLASLVRKTKCTKGWLYSHDSHSMSHSQKNVS